MTFLRKSIEYILGIILKKSVFNYCILKSESSYTCIYFHNEPSNEIAPLTLNSLIAEVSRNLSNKLFLVTSNIL